MSVAGEKDSAGPGAIRWGRGHVRHGRIPDWVLDAKIGDRAVRLYVVLGRYADEAGSARISKAKLMKRLRCARSTLDTALAELIALEAVEVVTHSRADEGQAANEYVLHWSAPDPAYPRVAPSGQSEGGLTGEPEGTRAGVDGSKPFEQVLPTTGPTAPGGGKIATTAPTGPPAVTLVEGRNLALDALCEALGIDSASPQVKLAVVAMNGRRSPATPGIRALFWIECERRAEVTERHAELAELAGSGENFERILADRVARKVKLIREQQPWRTHLAPTAVRDLWLDIENAAGPPQGGYSAEDLRRLRATE